MKKLQLLLGFISLIFISNVSADICEETNVTINAIRPVSASNHNEKHKNTVELHHSERNYCSLSDCAPANRYRVIIDANDTHVVSAAYMAFVAGKKVNITIDTGLGNRSGICVISYLTVLN